MPPGSWLHWDQHLNSFYKIKLLLIIDHHLPRIFWNFPKRLIVLIPLPHPTSTARFRSPWTTEYFSFYQDFLSFGYLIFLFEELDSIVNNLDRVVRSYSIVFQDLSCHIPYGFLHLAPLRRCVWYWQLHTVDTPQTHNKWSWTNQCTLKQVSILGVSV